MNAPLNAKHLANPTTSKVQGRTAPDHDVAQALSKRLARETRGEVLWSAADKGRYSTDASIYQITPVGVLVPKTLEDVRIALDICRELRVPIVPRGGGTSQCGQTVGVGLVIDYSKHINKIAAPDLVAQTV